MPIQMSLLPLCHDTAFKSVCSESRNLDECDSSKDFLCLFYVCMFLLIMMLIVVIALVLMIIDAIVTDD